MESSSEINQSKIRSCNWYPYIINGKRCIRGGICHSIYGCEKSNNKYIKVHDKNKESSILQYRDVSNVYGWAMLQELLVNNFEWIKGTSQFNENFIKSL